MGISYQRLSHGNRKVVGLKSFSLGLLQLCNIRCCYRPIGSTSAIARALVNAYRKCLLSLCRTGGFMSNRSTAIGIFLLAFIAFASLPQTPLENAQVVTRLGLTLTIIESGQLNIDRFADRTIDKASIRRPLLRGQGSWPLVSGRSRGGRDSAYY
jgi:hypothetical protein